MLVKRDPFGREELHRQSIDAHCATCHWCGNVKITKTGKKKLYEYYIEKDSIYQNKNYIKGLYCSNSCFKAYNE